MPFNDVYRDNFRRRIFKECDAFGIRFVFNDYLDEAVPKDGHVTTRKGNTLRADLVVRPLLRPVSSEGPTEPL